MSAFASCGARLSIAAILATQLPLPANAQSASAGSDESASGIESVVVTARRREESLQDVPVAISALTADQLQTQNVRTLEDMTAFAPNIKVNAGRATSSTINAYIRGVGQNDPLWGFEPGVGIYIDDVYIARPQGALLDVYDVERIEVLRGPQGTLYGKNTIAGAIKYVTRDIATSEPTLNVSATGGSYNQREIKVGGSIPVVDEHIFLGAAVAYLRRDGYGEIVDDGRARLYNRVGQDVSDKDVLAARANATFVWGDSSRLRILADTVQDNSNATGGQRLNNLTAAGIFHPRLNHRYDQRTDMPVDRDRFINKGVAATYTQTLTDALDLKLVGAYREGDGRQFIDFDELNANLFQVPAQYSDDQTSGEAQLTYTSDRVKGVAGVYYFTGQAEGAFDASLGSLGLTSLTKGSVDTDSIAVYFDTTWSLTDRLNLNVGARWNEDDKEARVFVAQYRGVLAPDATLFDENNLPPGFSLVAVQSNYTNDRSFSNVSPRLGMDFRLDDDLMLYFSYAQGFKSGGFDMRGNQLANPTTVNGYDAETADNFEVGMKSTWFEDTLQLNLTAFYTPYEDIQITTQQFVLLNGNPTNATAVLNAGKQVNQGVELETMWRPLSALTLVLNVGYLDAEFEEFFTACPTPTPGCRLDISGLNQPINSPDWTTFLGATYEWSLGAGDMTLHAGYQYRSATKVANTTASITDQDAYDILDLGIAYTTADERWRFAVDGKNILDEEYRVAGYDFGAVGPTGGFSQIGFYGPPRTVSVTATYRY
ncbi:TonB-dependent receptor [Steroidobacter sp. S1-65]|uniref:TonB-dependent receptor n=1 Tax=Steroidobacter gossypii TaxID=2805490 RepID=A0ABS1WSR5_9GAMM|nr:TonB-dependent receptor [Steroidobacter gossypii]MBM0104017.1 TonB-dependent receptor [Steroidobacter gossypii]